MTWIKAEYEFGSLFSYRIPGYPSPSYALSSPLPGPSTIKLAIVATAIETSGKVDSGEKIFEIIKNVGVKIRAPKKIALSNLFIKRLKKKKDKLELESTFGIRGYVHFSEPLNIYLNVKERNKDDIKELLKKVRRIGTSDSIVYCKNIDNENPPQNCIEPIENLEKAEKNVLVVPVKEINSSPKIKFEHVNPYSKKRKKDVFVNRFYLLTVVREVQGKNWIIYEIA